tara:strand:- start:398 stop:988 length:591 start_codon:yes stop_codon:yes gene_type:complete
MSKRNSSHLYRKVAQLHCDQINQGFLATLGPSFLTLLYEAIDKDESSVLIAKKVDGEIIGFISGGASLRPIFKQLLHRPFSLFLVLISCVFSISKLKKIIEILLIGKKNPILTGLPQHELFTIAVNPLFQGNGCAHDLFDSLCNYFKEINVTNFKIVVGSDLARPHSFYLKMGCIVAGEIEVHKGKKSMVYIKKCS